MIQFCYTIILYIASQYLEKLTLSNMHFKNSVHAYAPTDWFGTKNHFKTQDTQNIREKNKTRCINAPIWEWCMVELL